MCYALKKWKKVPVVKESHFSMGGAIKCTKSGGNIWLSFLFFSSTVNDVRRKLHMVGIHLTVGKRAKRMPDITVETTRGSEKEKRKAVKVRK